MAQDVIINGTEYTDVPAVEAPKMSGGTARFVDETIAVLYEAQPNKTEAEKAQARTNIGASDVSMAQNEQVGGVDITVDGETQTLAKQEDVADAFATTIENFGAMVEEFDAQKELEDFRWKMAQGIVWDWQEDSTAAYSKTVPAAAYGGALLELGGATVRQEQEDGTYVLQSAAVDKVVADDEEKEIPEAIRNLDGYGLGITDTVCNYIDFERKVFVKMVGSVDLGSLTWRESKVGGINSFRSNKIDSAHTYILSDYTAPILTQKYQAIGYSRWSTGIDKTMTLIWKTSNYEGELWVADSAYSTKASFKNAMSGEILYFELETPVEIDISEYLDDDLPLMDVEAGDTITFHQSGDTQLPVPNKEKYLIKLSEVVT